MKRVAIVGGGIAGISAAYYLQKAKQNGAGLDWTLFEKSSRLGGVIRTEYRDGCVLEAGPDSFLTVKPDAAQLCRELGLGDQLIPSNDYQRRTHILVKGKLVPIPDGLQFMVPTRIMPMVTTGLFSLGTKLRMASEWFSTAGNGNQDESVASFVRRHFGQQMVDRIAEPLLADAIVAALPKAALRAESTITSLNLANGKWQIISEKGTEDFDLVLLAVPAPFAASLLKNLNLEMSARLEKIQYTSSGAVALAYSSPKLPPGFGFLVPASENRKMLACTFVHKKFSYRVPQGTALLRCFFSSSRTPELLSYNDDDLKTIARQELKDILGLDLEPQVACAFRWATGLPQYETGHLDRAAEIEAQLSKLPGLHLIGNSLYGVGIPDCVKSARLAVEKITN
ncbi:MAG: hypothetical protein DMG65_01480 [Candidatus Angelobacter sp. Gp1-AA117]|nr:MAG: hypothetical protein DMG65_01480 [Candidatus Angelobacter sp. Gp1-AA117]